MFSLMSPFSRGSVQLSGPSPQHPLLIDPAYFANEQDLDRMVVGLRRAHEIATTTALAPWWARQLEPAFDTSDEDACRAYIRASAGSYFHPVGTCRIGTDEHAVVDPLLRVKGVEAAGRRRLSYTDDPLRQYQCDGARRRRARCGDNMLPIDLAIARTHHLHDAGTAEPSKL